MQWGRFAAVIGCIDGRAQPRTVDQVMSRFGVRHVDNITTPGAVQHLAGEVTPKGQELLNGLAISVRAHGTRQVAVVAHSDCAGNPVPNAEQKDQLDRAVRVVKAAFADLEVIGLFYDLESGFTRVG